MIKYYSIMKKKVFENIMKKQIIILAGLLLSASIMCGCGSTVPDLTEEESAMITEYATNLIVKHSEISSRELLSAEELEVGILEEAADRERQIRQKEIEQAYLNSLEEEAGKMEEAESDASDGGNSGSSEAAMQQKSMAEFLGESSFSIDYVSHKICNSYPDAESDDIFMAMDAAPGKVFCVVSFQVKNQTSQDQELNMLNKKERFTLRVDGSQTITAQSTLLMDDLSSYVGTIPANDSRELVLVFEVDEGISQIGSMELIMKDDSGENKVSLY